MCLDNLEKVLFFPSFRLVSDCLAFLSSKACFVYKLIPVILCRALATIKQAQLTCQTEQYKLYYQDDVICTDSNHTIFIFSDREHH
jgi:hypothetical protein